jgi:hypothetical protein
LIWGAVESLIAALFRFIARGVISPSRLKFGRDRRLVRRTTFLCSESTRRAWQVFAEVSLGQRFGEDFHEIERFP